MNALPARFSTVFATLTVSLANASVVCLALAELSLANTTRDTKNKHTKSMMTVLKYETKHNVFVSPSMRYAIQLDSNDFKRL